MPGLFSRLFGGSSQATAPLPFTLELPDGWVGGRPPDGYREALRGYGDTHPECADRVTELMGYEVGDGLYMAIDACGSDANMIVEKENVPRGLPAENALDAYVAANRDNLAAREDLIGQPTQSRTDIPFAGGRMLRWSWSYEGSPPSSFTLYAFASGPRLWVLTFSCDTASAEEHEAVFSAIASSFRLMQSGPTN